MNDTKSGLALMSTAISTALPQSKAARLDALIMLCTPQPIYCSCKSDCDVVVGESPPILSEEEVARLLSESVPKFDK